MGQGWCSCADVSRCPFSTPLSSAAASTQRLRLLSLPLPLHPLRPDLAGTPRYASDAWLNSLASLNGAAPQAHAGHAPPGGGGAPCATRGAAPKQNTPSPAPKQNAPAPAPEEDSPAPARPLRLAGHLCSSRVDEILAGDSAFVAAAAERLGIDRFQINATATNGVDVSVFADDAGADRCVS